MILPRRRVTSLTLVAIAILALYRFDYLPIISDLSLQFIAPVKSKEIGSTPLYSGLNSSEKIDDSNTKPASTQSIPNSPKPSNQGRPTRFSQGQHTFGSTKFFEHYPVKDYHQFSKGLALKLPALQHDFGKETEEAKEIRLNRLAAVETSFKHSWEGYKKHAWKKDELKPVDGGSMESFGGWAATLVDSLDTLWIMGMTQEFEIAVEAIQDLDFINTGDLDTLNVFETTIRYLGGFLAAYDISYGDTKYPVLLQKAIELGDLLYCAFDTPNRMPVTRWKLKEALEGAKQRADESTLVAEIGSLTLEFTRLSQLTGDLRYFDAIQRIMDEFHRSQPSTKLPGLWPTIMNAKQITFRDNSFTLGGMADSLYEYMPKQHMLLGGRSEQYSEMYKYAITAAMNHVFFQPMLPDNADVLISGSARVQGAENEEKITEPVGQHLSCFTGGMIGIGAKIFEQEEHMHMARKLVDGCIWAYDHMPSGIMPEVFQMVPCEMNSDCIWDVREWHKAVLKAAANHQKDDNEPEFANDTERLNHAIAHDRLPPGFVQIFDPRYVLRPEAIESVFILYRLTGEEYLLEAAWRMFTAIEKHTRTEIANSAIDDVTVPEPKKDNRMESFWLAETLKYFYLIFSEPGVVNLDDYVLYVSPDPLAD